MDKLKSCPFCGGNARLIIANNQYLVMCDGDSWCDAKQGWFSNELDAISAWNRRTPKHDAEVKFPDNNVEVLFFANGCVIPGYYVGSNGSHHVWKSSREGYIFLDDEVTHWMPLPRPPKEDKRWRTIV